MRKVATKKPITYTVDKLKNHLNIDYSEELFGIEKELPYQCPRIDSFISDIRAMQSHISRLKELMNDDENGNNKIYIKREFVIIEEYQDTLKDSFEEVRKACDSLRSRGEGWKKLARNLFDEVPNNKRFVDEKYRDKIE
jgi:hypothetical protein